MRQHGDRCHAIFLLLHRDATCEDGCATGTTLITAGQALTASPWTLSTSGGDVQTLMTMLGVPYTPTASNAGTPGYYRIVNQSTDTGTTHTAIQGLCTIVYTSANSYSSGTVAITHDTWSVTFSTVTTSGGMSPPAIAAGLYLTNIAGDASNGTYQITGGSGLTWTLSSPFNPGGSSVTVATYSVVTQPNVLQFSSIVAASGTITLSSMTWTEGNP